MPELTKNGDEICVYVCMLVYVYTCVHVLLHKYVCVFGGSTVGGRFLKCKAVVGLCSFSIIGEVLKKAY